MNQQNLFCLDYLIKYLEGGVILLDDYDKVYGATKAVDEFLKFHKSLKIKRKNKFGSTPYIIKN